MTDGVAVRLLEAESVTVGVWLPERVSVVVGDADALWLRLSLSVGVAVVERVRLADSVTVPVEDPLRDSVRVPVWVAV